MNRSIDVRNEVRKLASSKPVCAAAGAGVIASHALRELPARLGKLRHEPALTSLPAKASELPSRAAGLPSRAAEYVVTARAKALSEYERLVGRGQKALNGHVTAPAKRSPGGKGTKSE